ncbi:MAG: hypothetical protein IIA88_11750, partial [Bacteroidetes bacterium]|nr:hypothetical protein [Bacteroidota bacterium]
RKYCEVHNGKVVVNIPKDFNSKKVEVIIIAEKEEKKSSKQELTELLLKGPTWSEEELKAFNEAREHFNKWRTE